MDISEPESEEPDIREPIMEQDDEEFLDIDELVPDGEVGDQSEVEKLAVRLANQLVQFHGCCHDCHEHFNSEHAGEHETHSGLQTFVSEVVDGASNCPDVLSSGRIAHHDDDLAGSMSAAQKRWIFSGIHPDDPGEALEHLFAGRGHAMPDR
jgi:hypothetical protein